MCGTIQGEQGMQGAPESLDTAALECSGSQGAASEGMGASGGGSPKHNEGWYLYEYKVGPSNPRRRPARPRRHDCRPPAPGARTRRGYTLPRR
jgi:hypothetical protein